MSGFCSGPLSFVPADCGGTSKRVSISQLLNLEGTNFTGSTDEGDAMLDLSAFLSDDVLVPGEFVEFDLMFFNPDRKRFTFETLVWGVVP